MSVFKQFLSQDIIVTPFPVNKNFTILGDNFVSSNIGIDRYVGTNYSLSSSGDLGPTTGFISTGSYQFLVYNSIKELYYSNFISSSYGDEAAQFKNDNGIIVQLSGNINQQPRFENYLQSTLTASRYFPTGSSSQIGVISIPVSLYGEALRPKSFTLISPVSGSLTDDGEGNILYTSSSISNVVVGNIIYSHGIITLTNSTYSSSLINGFTTSSNVTMSFSSTYTIYETQYKCTVRESEFNLSYNPSLLSGSTLYDYATGSYFSPYITTVGLYNENQDLLAVAKLSKPLPGSPTTDTNIIINIDR